MNVEAKEECCRSNTQLSCPVGGCLYCRPGEHTEQCAGTTGRTQHPAEARWPITVYLGGEEAACGGAEEAHDAPGMAMTAPGQ